jgi:hypothetical protein
MRPHRGTVRWPELSVVDDDATHCQSDCQQRTNFALYSPCNIEPTLWPKYLDSVDDVNEPPLKLTCELANY